MKQFFKYLIASVLGFFISLFILIFIFLIFTFAIVSSFSTTETVSISENTILELRLDYELPERSSFEPVNFSGIPSMSRTLGLNDLVRLINSAKKDDRIEGIFLDLDNLRIGGLSKINTLRESLKDFKESSKFLIAHGNTISERAFYLASIADSLFITPTGFMEFDGFGIELVFFKGAIDKLEIEPQVFQYGKFKGATEPFKLNELSFENELQLSKYLNSVYNSFLEKISTELGVDKDSLKSLADNAKINSADDAKKFGFVDGLLYRDQVDSVMLKLSKKDSTPEKLNYKKYYYSSNFNSVSSDNRIAVIYALGEITNDTGNEYTIGTHNIIESIKKAKNNSRVKAIVMRVNSPGGSPLTADMIWREIKLAAEKKPFIVSMGETAASGGYYISSNADLIVAEESTLSGSIGVYGIIHNTQKFFSEKLGITFDRVETSESSNLYTITAPLTDQQKNIIRERINRIYFDFVSRVAEGRKMKFEEVDKLAEGRIWSGIDAVDIGLADTLGNLETALEIAADRAGIDDFKILEYPSQKEAFEKLIDFLYSDIQVSIDRYIFNEPFNHISAISSAFKYPGIQARLPFTFEIY